MDGFFISFEGIDGCGKSTQIEKVLDRLKKNDYETLLVREPGGTNISEQIRDILLDKENNNLSNQAESLLFLSSRAQLVEEKIIPALKQGVIVVSDRFSDSTLAYQGVGRKLGKEIINQLNDFATQNVYPDLTFVIDTSYDTIISRNGLGDDRMELNSKDFFVSISNFYRELATTGLDRYCLVDGDRDIETIHDDIWSALCKKLDL